MLICQYKSTDNYAEQGAPCRSSLLYQTPKVEFLILDEPTFGKETKCLTTPLLHTS